MTDGSGADKTEWVCGLCGHEFTVDADADVYCPKCGQGEE